MSRAVMNLNDRLVAQAKKFSGLSDTSEVVNYALMEFVQRSERARPAASQSKRNVTTRRGS